MAQESHSRSVICEVIKIPDFGLGRVVLEASSGSQAAPVQQQEDTLRNFSSDNYRRLLAAKLVNYQKKVNSKLLQYLF